MFDELVNPEDEDAVQVVAEGVDVRKLDKSEQAERIRGLVQAGHGFKIETVTRDDGAREPRCCEICGALLTQPADDWLCECEPGPWSERSPERELCECGWCLHRQLVVQGRYLSQGRPRVQCGSADCKRLSRNARQRERRRREKAEASARV
ncbi:MAG: hypothetical protein ACRC20_07170 [Segniliparus sp.]|uniref:hypothetical protein n=1 Tax=Segniliparus sp. TaxID=2804064 RepID=UPI003F2C2AAF